MAFKFTLENTDSKYFNQTEAHILSNLDKAGFEKMEASREIKTNDIIVSELGVLFFVTVGKEMYAYKGQGTRKEILKNIRKMITLQPVG